MIIKTGLSVKGGSNSQGIRASIFTVDGTPVTHPKVTSPFLRNRSKFEASLDEK